MASINYSLSTKSNIDNEKEILVRFTHGRINQRGKTSIFILDEYWDIGKQKIIIPNFRMLTIDKKELKKNISYKSEKLNRLTSHIHKSFNSTHKDEIPKDWLKTLINEFNYPRKEEVIINKPFFELLDEFLTKRKISEARIKRYYVLKRALQRFELFISMTQDKLFWLDIDTLTLDCH